MSEDIKKIRQKIDSLDNDILDLFNQRAHQAVLIAKEKNKSKELLLSLQVVTFLFFMASTHS